MVGTPSGTQGYDDLVVTPKEIDLDHLKLCDLEDLIRIKAAAGRPKDQIELEVLRAVRDERSR